MTDGISFDPYKTLGVERDADERAIKSAYRKLAKDFHPDLNRADPQLAEKFRLTTKAYEMLADRDKRAAYDAHEAVSKGFETTDEPPSPRPSPRRPPPRPEASRQETRPPTGAPRGANPPRSDDPANRWAAIARRRAAWERGSLVLLIAALILALGTLLLRILTAILGGASGHDGPILGLILLLVGFVLSLKLGLIVAGIYLRERGYDQWSAGALVFAIILLLSNPQHLSIHVMPSSQSPAASDASPVEGVAGSMPPGTAFPQSASSADRPVETMPAVSTGMLQPAPVPGLSVPSPALLRFGFARASETHVYTKEAYKTIFTQTIGGQGATVAFSESLSLPYEGIQSVDQATAQPFSFQGSPGYLVYRALGDGTVEGTVHWNDHGLDLAVHTVGLPVQAFTAQDLFQMLAAVRRTPDLGQPAHTAVSAPAVPPPGARSDPCGPGTVCYDRANYGHGWFIRRGHGSDHPS